jgi:hypothetical protein
MLTATVFSFGGAVSANTAARFMALTLPPTRLHHFA